MEDIAILGDMIRLGQLLKLANLVDRGADAKSIVARAEVTVNGEVEIRRGRQLVRSDVIAVGGHTVRLV